MSNIWGRNYFSQIFASVAGTLVFLSNGMEMGWTSSSTKILMSNDSYIPITNVDIHWIEAAYFLGGLAGMPISFIFLHFVGRRTVILTCSSISCTCWILIASATNVLQIKIARGISEFATCTVFGAVPIYISEITEPRIRGSLASLVFTMNLIGMAAMYCIGPFMTISGSATVGASINVIQIIVFYFQPESPYYLLNKNRKDMAIQMLRRLRYNSKSLQQEIELMESSIRRQKAEKQKQLNMLKVDSVRKGILISAFLNITQNFLGIAVMSMNVHRILEHSDAFISNSKSAIVFGLVMIASSIFGSFTIDRFGRRLLFLTSTIFTTISHATLSGYFFARDITQADCTGLEWIPAACVISYAIFFKFGAGLLPVIVPAEILPISVKAFGMVVIVLSVTASGLISVHVYFFTMHNLGIYVPFLCFALWGVFSTVVFYFYVPETKCKTLEEIQMILKERDSNDIEMTEEMVNLSTCNK